MAKQEVDHGKEARMDRAKGRSRGMFLVLLAKCSGSSDASAEGENDAYEIVANENAALVTDDDVRAWLEENEYLGTVYACRFLRSKSEGCERRSFSRVEQRTFSIVEG